ncbi:hypothetical protein Q8A67_019454 [Cirrhinus molitorella]|uniref:Uncharacterized protein n=1 Tax=Cirrhinus molitorella TaxID=172907 RepID=A0AA88PAR6_9TELE|nr:hypothetical protein Q8A67_019454 [Cirrhinus molitorella]
MRLCWGIGVLTQDLTPPALSQSFSILAPPRSVGFTVTPLSLEALVTAKTLTAYPGPEMGMAQNFTPREHHSSRSQDQAVLSTGTGSPRPNVQTHLDLVRCPQDNQWCNMQRASNHGSGQTLGCSGTSKKDCLKVVTPLLAPKEVPTSASGQAWAWLRPRQHSDCSPRLPPGLNPLPSHITTSPPSPV